MPTKFTVQQNDITSARSDLLLLKHAKGFHGGDLVVANELNRAEFRLRLVLRLDHSGGQEAYFHGLAFQGEPEVLARKFYSVVRHVRSSPPNG